MPNSELERRQSPPTSTSTSLKYPSSISSSHHQPHIQNSNISYQIPYHTTSSTPQHSSPSPIPGISHLSHPQPYSSNPVNFASIPQHPVHGPPTPITLSPLTKIYSSSQLQQTYGATPPPQQLPQIRDLRSPAPDPFHSLRAHNLATKLAWTAIPSSEGARILEICKRNSFVDGHDDQSQNPHLHQPHSYYDTSSSTASSRKGSVVHSPMSASPPHIPNALQREERGDRASGQQQHVPCYNRRVLFDEEWQAHMRDVHGVFLLWPDTWMKRIEVLDLDPFGGDIGVCNDVIMDS